jgi:hypothetical protein
LGGGGSTPRDPSLAFSLYHGITSPFSPTSLAAFFYLLFIVIFFSLPLPLVCVVSLSKKKKWFLQFLSLPLSLSLSLAGRGEPSSCPGEAARRSKKTVRAAAVACHPGGRVPGGVLVMISFTGKNPC